MYQINLSLAIGLYQYRHHPIPVQQQDGRLAFFNEYVRQNYPVNQQQESPYNTAVFADAGEPISRLNWFKRDLRLNTQGNKRMLCFFHAVNCFG